MSKVAAVASRFVAAMGFAQPPVSAEDPKKEDDDTEAKPARLDGESDEDYNKRCEDEKKKKDEEARKAESDDEEKKEATAFADGVQAERARWSAVLSAPQSAGRGVTACNMLADTDMTAAQICSTLATIPQAKPTGGLATRMAAAAAAVPVPAPGGAEAPAAGTPAAVASAITAAAAKARGETKAA